MSEQVAATPDSGAAQTSEAAQFLETEGLLDEGPAHDEQAEQAEEVEKKPAQSAPEGDEDGDASEDAGEETQDEESSENAETDKKKKVSGIQRLKMKVSKLEEQTQTFQKELSQYRHREEELASELTKVSGDAEFWYKQAQEYAGLAEEAGANLDPVQAENAALKERLRRIEEDHQMREAKAERERQQRTQAETQKFVHWISNSATAVANQFGVDRKQVIQMAKMEYHAAGGDHRAINWKEIASTLAGYQNLKKRGGAQQLKTNSTAPKVIKPGSRTPHEFGADTKGAIAFLRSVGLED